ncbi:iron-siderophore ABC transporter substrate-binding protein [Paenibacillus turpanensis]|uniref:ABC transporter substrate-binding protein n=1 Tax=Paenibacillus turpanensis TaxID=2689078 RepID=UPI00140CA76F
MALVAMLLIVAMTAVGCGGKTTPVEQSQGTEAPKAEAPKDTSYTVKHAMGETKIPAAPKRVVILTNEGTEALLALGITPVGAVKSWVGDPWYPHIKEKMNGVVELGTESQPNIEAIAGLNPDLIIGNKLRQEKVYEQLSAIAPTVFSETLRGEWKSNFKLYAEAINKKEDGDKIVADFDKRIEEFKAAAGDKLKQKVSVVRFMAGQSRIYYKQTFSGVIFEQIGIARPDSQNKDEFAATNVSKERIPEMDGDILFYFTYETGDGKANQVEQDWINDPLWNNLNVVKAGNVHKVSDTIWNTAGGVLAANLLLDDLQKFYGISK